MPIISGDKHQYFRPATTIANARTGPAGRAATAVPTGAGAQAVAHEGGKAAELATAFGAQLEKQASDSQYSRAVAQFHQLAVRREIEADQMEDYETAPETTLENLHQDMGDLAQSISFPEARQQFSSYAQNLMTHTVGRVSWRTRKRQVDELTSDLFEDVEANLNALNRRPQDWQIIEQEIVRSVDQGARNGLISFEKAQVYKSGLQERIDEMRIKHLMADAYAGRIEPGMALAQMWDKEQFTRVDPLRRAELSGQFEKQMDYLERRSEDREFQSLQREHTRMRYRQEAYFDQYSSRVHQLVMGASGESEALVETAILEAEAARKISGGQAQTLLNLLGGDEPLENDPAALVEAFQGIYTGSMGPEQIAAHPGLKRGTRSSLIQSASAYENRQFNEKVKDWSNKIKAFIVTTGPLQGLNPGEQVRLQDAYIDFNDQVQAARQEGGPVDLEGIALDVIDRYGDPGFHLDTLPNIQINTNAGTLTYRPTLDRARLDEMIRTAYEANDQAAIVRLRELVGYADLAERRQQMLDTRKQTQERR